MTIVILRFVLEWLLQAMHCGWICALAKKELYDALSVECLSVVLVMDASVLWMVLVNEAILVLVLVAYLIAIMSCEAGDSHLAMDNVRLVAVCVGFPTAQPWRALTHKWLQMLLMRFPQVVDESKS